MAKVRDILKRDIGLKIEGVVKVFDPATLASEIREYVVTDKIEEELKRIFDTFTLVSESLRRGTASRDVMGMWISGFFGSGKSHFAKVLGYVLQNEELADGSGERPIDTFIRHLSDTPRARDIRLRLGEIKLNTVITTVPFEIKSRQSLNNPNSVGEILLSEFYRHIGLAENVIVARIERRLQQRGLLDRLAECYRQTFGVLWKSAEGRDDLMTVRRRLAEILPQVDPGEFPDEQTAKEALNDMFRHERITAEGIADELVAWIDSQKTTGARARHLIFVVDEMGTFIGDSTERIAELNSLAEMIGNKGKGKVWLVVTSQQDLEKVVDRTRFQPALVGRLNARFELKPHLISDEINKVVSERILKKHPADETTLRALFRANEGKLEQLADLKSSRNLGWVDERSFLDCYPFLPHQIRLAQDIFEALSGFRISGGVRSMISVVMDALQDVANQETGVLVSFDQVFDAVENDLFSQEYLGASGIRSIYESDERVLNTPLEASRILKVLWLLQQITWVPRVPETLAKLLVRDFTTEISNLRGHVERTLKALQAAGYVARDEASGEWKLLNERERTIEQAIQEIVRPGEPRSISLATVRRTAQQICKEALVTRKKLRNFAVTYGRTNVPFAYGVYLDGEAIETGPELELRFISPIAPARKQETDEVRSQNQTAGVKGKTVWWIAATSDDLENHFRRYEALLKVTTDKRFTEDTSKSTQDALAEKRKERDELRVTLAGELESAFCRGTVFRAGQEIELERAADLAEPVNEAFIAIIPNLYPCFAVVDRAYDFTKQLKALLNPATTALHQAAPGLDLFDTQGNLQRESALVSQVLEVLRDLEDEGRSTEGAELLDSAASKGFRGFLRPPFGWPDELVRLVLAACFRAGAVCVEHQTGTGIGRIYDYRGTDTYFAKITLFKKLAFRVAETSLTVEQIKQAGKTLIALGVTGIPESGNAIASAIRSLGRGLKASLDDARTRAQQGLPVPDSVLSADTALAAASTSQDPTECVVTFLAVADQWRALAAALIDLRAFLDADRHKDFRLSVCLAEVVNNHPAPQHDPGAKVLSQALLDMTALTQDKAVISRWRDYRDAFDQMFHAYRDAYLQTYTRMREATEETIASIKNSGVYRNAPADAREQVLAKTFAAGGACCYPAITLPTVQALLDATSRRSLSALEQAGVALPGYRVKVEQELAALYAPSVDERVYEWRPAQALLGKRFQTEDEVDHALHEIGAELKAQIRRGYRVIVK